MVRRAHAQRRTQRLNESIPKLTRELGVSI